MENLTKRMRSLAIESMKSRREAIFERTRNLIGMRETGEEESVCSEGMGEEEIEVEVGVEREV